MCAGCAAFARHTILKRQISVYVGLAVYVQVKCRGAVFQGTTCSTANLGAVHASHLCWRWPNTSKALWMTHSWILHFSYSLSLSKSRSSSPCFVSSLTSCWTIHTRYKSSQTQRMLVAGWNNTSPTELMEWEWGCHNSFAGFCPRAVIFATLYPIIYHILCDILWYDTNMFCGTPGLPYNPYCSVWFEAEREKNWLKYCFHVSKKNMLKACKTILLVYQYTANLNWLWNKLRASPNWWLQGGGGMGAILTRHPQSYKADFPAEQSSPLQSLFRGHLMPCPSSGLSPVTSEEGKLCHLEMLGSGQTHIAVTANATGSICPRSQDAMFQNMGHWDT